MNKSVEYVIDAIVDSDTFERLLSGELVNNNGIRTKNGTFWSKQPDFRAKNFAGSSGMKPATRVLLAIGTEVAAAVILPLAKEAVAEHLVPHVKNKIKERKDKRTEVVELENESTNNVIDIRNFIKTA